MMNTYCCAELALPPLPDVGTALVRDCIGVEPLPDEFSVALVSPKPFASVELSRSI